jgi:hypothetical protein
MLKQPVVNIYYFLEQKEQKLKHTQLRTDVEKQKYSYNRPDIPNRQ